MSQYMTREEEMLIRRLESWKREKETNKNGMAHLADRAIAAIERDLADLKGYPHE